MIKSYYLVNPSISMNKYVNETVSFELPRLSMILFARMLTCIKGKRKIQGVPQSQTAALSRPQEEEETDKSKQAQTEQTYEKH